MTPTPTTRPRSLATAIKATALVLLVATPAWGYVDPGIIATLYQLAYVVAFGAFTALAIKPARFIKASWKRLRQLVVRDKQA